jgi:hypothetical protein
MDDKSVRQLLDRLGYSSQGYAKVRKATYFLALGDKSNYLPADCLKKNIRWEVHDLIGHPIFVYPSKDITYTIHFAGANVYCDLKRKK